MKVEKVINNNIIVSFNEQNKEIVVMGRGLGFQKKPGDQILDDQIEKVFLISDKNQNTQFQVLLEKIPLEHVSISDEIIAYARQQLNKELSENIYIVLTDHINYAIERKNKGIILQNALLWEIKKFYQQEFFIGMKAIEIIKNNLCIELGEDEAGFIALHIVNAELGYDMEEPIAVTKKIQAIINIVKYFYKVELNENSISYERFITHLKFMLQRMNKNSCYETDDASFNETIKKQYPIAFECACRIKEYMKLKYDYELAEEEIMYLTVHIQRIAREYE